MAKTEKARLWAKRIAAFERSGMSRRTWCAGQGLNASTLDYWRVRLRTVAARVPQRTQDNSPGSATTPIVVPIVVEPTHARRAGGPVEIDLPGRVRLHVVPGVDAAWLAALIRGVAGC